MSALLFVWKAWATICGAVGLLLALHVALMLKGEFAIARQRRKADRLARKRAREEFEHRRRGRILKVGQILNVDGQLIPWGFSIDCEHALPAYCQAFDGERTQILYGGYTTDELLEIAAHRKDWE